MGRLFGTDGVRGVANTELTCELAFDIGRAAATVLTAGGKEHPAVLVGKDTRISSDMLEAALNAGLCSVGCNVYCLGVIPTPAVAYLIGKYGADAGIMISASHNPCEFNGIKIFNGDGYKLPDALEEKIESLILEKDFDFPTPTGGQVGRVFSCKTAVRDYIEHIKSTVIEPLTGLKVAFDCANGAASRTARILFTELGADCRFLSDQPNGVNINNRCGSTHLEALQRYVVENNLDAGIAFDGDADRCLAVDETGAVVDGDFIMAICGAELKSQGRLAKDTIVGTILTNMGLQRFCEENNLRFDATQVGDRYILEQMLLEDYNFGGEQSGHVIFLDHATTGDGQLTASFLLSILHRRKAKFSSLTTLMRRFPQVMVNVQISAEGKLLYYTDAEIRHAVQKAEDSLGTRGRIIVRPSGTEPLIRVMTEGEDQQEIEAVAHQVADIIRERLA